MGGVEIPDSDLTTHARIRNAAIEGFAAGTLTSSPSIRVLAKAAGVSAGSVQHFFPTKATLRKAVNDHVVSLLAHAFGAVTTGESGADVSEELGRRIAAFVREQPLAIRYVSKALVEGDDTARGLFDALVTHARDQWAQAEHDGLLPPDTDQLWAALHVVVLNVGTVLLEDVINRHLPEPFTTPDGLQRWRLAQTALFRGLYRQEHK